MIRPFSLSLVGFFLFLMMGSLTTARAGQVSLHQDPLLRRSMWSGVRIVYAYNLQVAARLLLREYARPHKDAAARLRVKYNAASILRMCKAYQFYLKKLSLRFAAQKKILWEPLSQRVKALARAAKLVSVEVLSAKQTPATQTVLKQLLTMKSLPFDKNVPTSLSREQAELLLETLSGLGAGGEMLSYFRLRQLTFLLYKGDKKDQQKALSELKIFLSELLQERAVFRQLRKLIPKAKWLSPYVYHLALLARAASLSGKAASKKGAERASLLKRYSKRVGELFASLKRANASFRQIWKPAAGE